LKINRRKILIITSTVSNVVIKTSPPVMITFGLLSFQPAGDGNFC